MKTMFEPNLVLTVEPDGDYTLHAVTMTPNSSFGAGRAERGVPPNVRLLPEVESVLLHIKHRGSNHVPILKPVRHHLADLKLGARHGKTTLTAFMMIGDSVVGSASLDVSNLGGIHPGDGKDKPMPIDTSDWYAWLDRMPPGPPTLHVRGTVTVPSSGYDVHLVEAAPQGINPKDLILDLGLERRPGMWPQVVTQLAAAYTRRENADLYESVLVRLADGSGIQVPVEQVY